MSSPLYRLALCTFVVSAMLLATPVTSPAQDVAATSSPVSVVPHLIKFSSSLPGAPGKAETVELKFALYGAQAGGDPLWTETQQVSLDANGKYSVLLGSVTALPASVFAQGQARWIGVALGSQEESVRTILAATAYSLKASDSETLGGHPASDFALKNALPSSGADITQINVGNGVTGGGTGPTVTLGLSSSYLETLGNEIYPQLGGTNKLTGTNTYTAGKLLVGTSPVLSASNLLAASPITVSSSGGNVTVGLSDTALVTLGNSVYAQLGAADTFTKPMTFASGQTFPGTVSLSANNNFSGSNTFSKAITFASGQTFPSTGTITGVTAGTGLSGGGSSGAVTLSVNAAALESTYNGVYAGLSASNTFTGTNNFSGGSNFHGLVTVQSSTTGAAVLASGNATSGIGVSGTAYAGLVGTGSSSGGGALSTSGTGVTGIGAVGMYGLSTFNGSGQSAVGVYGLVPQSSTAANSAGVWGEADGGGSSIGVYGIGVIGLEGKANAAGAIGVAGTGPIGVQGTLVDDGYGIRGSANTLSFDGSALSTETSAGIWGDFAEGYGAGTGILATADSYPALTALNSSGTPTVEVYNYTSATHDPVFETYSPNTYSGARHCTIDTSANFTCNGVLTGVVHEDGGAAKAVYSVSSADNWIEDAGAGQLSAGHANVTLDLAFAGTVNTGVDYHVFLTPKGESENLYVVNESASGFEVREAHGGKSNIAFDYRIMAKRKGYESVRLEDLTAQENADKERMAERAATAATAKPHVIPAFRAPKGPGAPMVAPPNRMPPAQPMPAAHTAPTRANVETSQKP